MGAVTYDLEITAAIPPAKMFKAFVLDSETLIPKILPQAIKSIETLEGDGGPGTIKRIKFGEGRQFKFMECRIDVLDKEKFKLGYSVIEGDALLSTHEEIPNEIKFDLSPDGGCICKSTGKYYTTGEMEISFVLGMFKALERYILDNPDY